MHLTQIRSYSSPQWNSMALKKSWNWLCGTYLPFGTICPSASLAPSQEIHFSLVFSSKELSIPHGRLWVLFSCQGSGNKQDRLSCDSKLSVVDPLELCVFKSVSFNYICLSFPLVNKMQRFGSDYFWVSLNGLWNWEVNCQLIHKVAPCDSNRL